MFQDVGLPALCLLSSGLKHEIKSCVQQHANLISESVCNDSVSACHNVGHAATRSAVLCVCVCVFLCSHYINQSPKHLPDHRSSCRRDLGIHNTCRSKIHNSGSSEEDRDRSWSLLCVLVVTFFEVFFFNHLHRCSQLKQSLHCSFCRGAALLGVCFVPQGHLETFKLIFFCPEIHLRPGLEFLT